MQKNKETWKIIFGLKFSEDGPTQASTSVREEEKEEEEEVQVEEGEKEDDREE